PIDAFPFIEARLGAISSQSPTAFSYPGATPSISANGDSNAVVWTVEAIGDSGLAEATNCLMHAYAATNLSDELYNTTQMTNRDILGIGQKFTTPVVASGRVYIQSTNTVVVYGLLSTSSLAPIQQWRNAHFGNPSNVGRGANSACPARDGIPNLAKYALGLNPSIPANLSQLVTSSLQNSNGQYFLTLTLQPWNNPPEVTFSTGVSSDLLNWSILSNISVLANTPSNLVVQDNQPVNSCSNSFVRLQFQLNSP
ncbi:MAG TPA: hypothetical protein VGN61_10660, partial [Verrucomicrobiae bacterium]